MITTDNIVEIIICSVLILLVLSRMIYVFCTRGMAVPVFLFRLSFLVSLVGLLVISFYIPWHNAILLVPVSELTANQITQLGWYEAISLIAATIATLDFVVYLFIFILGLNC